MDAPTNSLAFAPCVSLRISTPRTIIIRSSVTAHPRLRAVSRPAPPRLHMTATPPPDSEDTPPQSKPDANDEESGVSFWGVASFAIILAIFMVGIVATIARDFIPGGMTTPANM